MNQSTMNSPVWQATPGAAQVADGRPLPFTRFVWGAGVESSALAHLNVDQYQWTQHDRFWKDDLRRASEDLGISHLRYSLPWQRLEPRPGCFDFGWADERIAEMANLGLEPVLDVMHFGTPLWLRQAVGDPLFPEALERLAVAMVQRYRSSVRTWCPFNEPLVAALFSGDFGFWPPHARKWRGYMPVLSRIVLAVNRAMGAIRREMPQAVVVLCDAAENYKTRVAALNLEVRRRNLRRFLVLDLLAGKVDRRHPLFPWLTDYGFSELDLEWFQANPQLPDVLGLDYYSHSDWQLDLEQGSVRQRRSDTPAGLYGIGKAYYQRYGLPLLLTETSIEGQPINREIWFDQNLEDCRRLRQEGIPMLGFFWWPLVDQIDWDGALTHRIGKVHEVGLYTLRRQADGTLARIATPMVRHMRRAIEQGEQAVGALEQQWLPSDELEDQGPPIGVEAPPLTTTAATQAAVTAEPQAVSLVEMPAAGNGNGNGQGVVKAAVRQAEVAGMAAEPAANHLATQLAQQDQSEASKATGRYGIVVFSHLRWGFVWQRPQQFLSRFARKHRILFVEEPMFDLKEGSEPRTDLHRVMPNVVVATPHMSDSWSRNPALPELLRKLTRGAIEDVNEDGAFDRPLLWYYSPMDSSWSLGHVPNRGVIYDAMDELSQFTGAPRKLIDNEKRLMECADVVFAGGYQLGEKKRQRHPNVHTFGCGVEIEHFGKAMRPDTVLPPDIDFMARPILGWFGVVDERVDYGLLHDLARLRPQWSIAMVGPVVKIDPNLLPHSPNLFWLGSREYSVLPNYCRAFDVCIMPFALNAATEFINPTKALEYMATGRPIVSTPVKDVVRQWSDLVYVGRGAEEWAALVEKILAKGPDVQQRIDSGLERARAGSWDGTVRNMQELIQEAIGRADRRSLKMPPPLTQVELEYLYQPTPGS